MQFSKKISDLSPNQKAIVEGFSISDKNTLYLQELGLFQGTVFEFVRAAPFGDPIEIKLRGYRLTLRKEEAQKILVTELVS